MRFGVFILWFGFLIIRGGQYWYHLMHTTKNRFNIKNAKKCLANTKRTKTPCQSPAMKNGRCRLHGGKSTGARTRQGIKKLRQVNLIHGKYTKEWIEMHRESMRILKFGEIYLKAMGLI